MTGESSTTPVFYPDISFPSSHQRAPIDDSVKDVTNKNQFLTFIKQYLTTGLPTNVPEICIESIKSKQYRFLNSEYYKNTYLYKIFLLIKYTILQQQPKTVLIYGLRWEYFLDIIITGLEELDPNISETFNTFYIDFNSNLNHDLNIDEIPEEIELTDKESTSFIVSSEITSLTVLNGASVKGVTASSLMVHFDGS